MAETELLPCVRCGGEMALHENDWADPPMWSAYCLALETCGIHMPERLTRDEAIVVANWRTPPSTAGWLPISTAPKDGKPIEALYADGSQDVVQWEEHRACMLGARAGAYPPGWQDVYNRLPVEDPILWRPAA